MKTSELTGAALDWAVDKCQGREWESVGSFLAYHDEGQFNYSTDWSLAGPIIEREKITVSYPKPDRICTAFAFDWAINAHGPAPLIAAMRCFVASKLGDDVDVPEGLC